MEYYPEVVEAYIEMLSNECGIEYLRDFNYATKLEYCNTLAFNGFSIKYHIKSVFDSLLHR